MSELRWNPLLGEWVATASHRQDRAIAPQDDFCPFCPSRPGEPPSEISEPDFDIAVFENRYPSLRPDPPEPAVSPSELYQVRPGVGRSEVVLYSPDHRATLAHLPVEKLDRLVRVWTDRFEELGRQDFIKYVMPFENKGEAIGVLMRHPHGQIYAYPFVPPRVARELDQARTHQDQTGRCLVCDILREEIEDGRRVVARNESFVAYVPFFARWPYEVHIASVRHLQALPDLTRAEQRDLAAMLKTVTVAYDRLFDLSFPYVMVVHQKPTDGQWYDYYHFHVEFYPPMRSATKLKFVAGSETGAGLFVNDTIAEEKAAELRKHVIPVEWADGEVRP